MTEETKPVPIVPNSATAQAYAEMEAARELAPYSVPRVAIPFVTPTRLLRPDDPDQGIALKTGDRYANARAFGARRMLFRGPYNFNSAGEAVRSETLHGVRMQDVKMSGGGKCLWGLNVYEVDGVMSFERVETTRMGIYPEPTNGGRVEGHGFYLHMIAGGNAHWSSCNFRYLMGNGIQVVRRIGESAIEPEPDYSATPTTSTIDATMFNVSQGKERGSFPVAWYAAGDLYVKRLHVVYPGGSTQRGGLLVGDPQSYMKLNRTTQRTQMAHIDELVIVDHGVEPPTHPGVQVQGVDLFTADRIINAGSRPRKFVFDEDCEQIDVQLIGLWEVVRRTRKDLSVAPEKSGFTFYPVQSRSGISRFQYQRGAR